MRIQQYTYTFDPDSKHSCLVYFDKSMQNCGVYFDVPDPSTCWDEYPAPVRNFPALHKALNPRDDNQFTEEWVAFELLRQYVLGIPIPTDGESGIERHFRELESAA